MFVRSQILLLMAGVMHQCSTQYYIRHNYIDRYRIGLWKIINSVPENEITVTEVSHRVKHNLTATILSIGKNIALGPGGSSEIAAFPYRTGMNAPFDYWYISVEVNGSVYQAKTNFFCNISAEDDIDNEVTLLVLKKEIFDIYSLTVIPPRSSSCWTLLVY